MDEKKKKSKMTDGAAGSRAEKLSAVVKGANKEFKKPVLSRAQNSDMLVVPRVTTGLYGLDVKTNGGYPLGRVMMVYGPAKGGKTTTYLRAVGEAQKLCANCHGPGVFKSGKMEMPNLETGEIEQIDTDIMVSCPCGKPRDPIVLWIDAEGVWLPEWSKRMGVITEKVILMRPSYGEQAYDVITAFVSVKEIDIVVIDSLAALTPEAEYEASMKEQGQGVAARMNNKFIRKLVSGLNDGFQEGRMMTLWMINQYREKIGVMFGPNEVLPGGKGQLFASSLEIEFRPGNIETDKETGEALIGKFKYVVKKNKLGVSGGKGEFQQCMADNDLFRVGDLLEHDEVVNAAVVLGIVGKPSKVTYEYNGDTFRGIGQLVRYFGENKEEYENLKDQMLRRKLGIGNE